MWQEWANAAFCSSFVGIITADYISAETLELETLEHEHSTQLGGLYKKSASEDVPFRWLFPPLPTLISLPRQCFRFCCILFCFSQLGNWVFKQFFFPQSWQVYPFTLTFMHWWYKSTCRVYAIALKEWQHLKSSQCIPIHHNSHRF